MYIEIEPLPEWRREETGNNDNGDNGRVSKERFLGTIFGRLTGGGGEIVLHLYSAAGFTANRADATIYVLCYVMTWRDESVAWLWVEIWQWEFKPSGRAVSETSIWRTHTRGSRNSRAYAHTRTGSGTRAFHLSTNGEITRGSVYYSNFLTSRSSLYLPSGSIGFYENPMRIARGNHK